MNSLRYLISTSKVGEIIIWFNGQIKKQISLKLEIHQILIIPRPSNHNPNYTQMLVKQTKPRIKALHKYEQGK
jgi:superfamily I DNA and RNA helicase